MDLAQALRSPFGKPSLPRAKPERARTGAISASNSPQLPVQVHVAAANTQHSSAPSSSRPDASPVPHAANSASIPARYQSVLSVSSVFLVYADNSSTSPTTPNVSPLSGQRSGPISSSPTIYNPSDQNRKVADRALRIVTSSPTLVLDQDQQTPLIKYLCGVQLELTKIPNDVTSKYTAQPTENSHQLVEIVERASQFGKIADADHIRGGTQKPFIWPPLTSLNHQLSQQAAVYFPHHNFRPWQS